MRKITRKEISVINHRTAGRMIGAGRTQETIEFENNVPSYPEKKVRKSTPKIQGAPSNKRIVYDSWKSGNASIPTLHSLVNLAVKESTIKSWISSWGRKQNLPGGVF